MINTHAPDRSEWVLVRSGTRESKKSVTLGDDPSEGCQKRPFFAKITPLTSGTDPAFRPRSAVFSGWGSASSLERSQNAITPAVEP